VVVSYRLRFIGRFRRRVGREAVDANPPIDHAVEKKPNPVLSIDGCVATLARHMGSDAIPAYTTTVK